MSPNHAVPRAPYSLEPTVFPFPALATMAGRAPLGGPREVALAWLMVGRLLRDSILTDGAFTAEQAEHRSQAAKHWLGSAAIPTPVRNGLARLCDASVQANRAEVRSVIRSVIAITADQLDQAARLELDRLAQAFAG